MSDETKPVIPQDDAIRKAAPMFRGLLGYFPGACFHVAAHSMASDRKHNGHLPEDGAPRWNRGKSADHDDCILRHTAEMHSDPLYHKTARAWRALADLQEYLERELGYAPGAHSVAEGSDEPADTPNVQTCATELQKAIELAGIPGLVVACLDDEDDVTVRLVDTDFPAWESWFFTSRKLKGAVNSRAAQIARVWAEGRRQHLEGLSVEDETPDYDSGHG